MLKEACQRFASLGTQTMSTIRTVQHFNAINILRCADILTIKMGQYPIRLVMWPVKLISVTHASHIGRDIKSNKTVILLLGAH